MDLLRLLGWAVVGIGAAVAVAAVIQYLTYDRILNWFQQREPLLAADCDRIGLSIMECLSNGNYRVCAGVFNSRTEQMIEQEVFEARNVDSYLKELHQDGYAIYTLENS